MTKPILIAGPCSAETREQIMETAAGLVALKPDYFRAGIWKPRTRPGEFEGIGKDALPWLLEAREKYGLKLATEVAKAEHVDAVLKAGFDMVWIGARSTANPFTVQEIADALSGVDIPVMVKNPTNADLKLWLGAIERVEKAGIKDISAIHRGFSVYEKTKYRNNPNWQIPIALKQERKELPLICDPSHITGKSELIQRIAQKAYDLKYDGLMIETHCNPSKAWTDARQQVTPLELENILSSLEIRNREEFKSNELLSLREEIDGLDDEIIRLLKERMQISAAIGNHKKITKTAILQQSRWQELIEKNRDRAHQSNLSPDFLVELYKLIHEESIRIQYQILTTKDE